MYKTLSLTVMSVLLSAFLVAPSVQAVEPPGEPYFCKCAAPGGLQTVYPLCLVRSDSAARAFERARCDNSCGYAGGHGVVIPCKTNQEVCIVCDEPGEESLP